MPSRKTSSRHDATLKRWLADLPEYAQSQLRILDKSNRQVPLVLNAIQRDLHRRLEAQRASLGRVRVIILKARQVGISTYLAARMFWHAHLRKGGARCYVLAHDDATAKKLAKMPKGMWNALDPALRRPALKQNDHELELANSALLEYHTAGQGTKGRGGTISHFHSSEVGFQAHAAMHMGASLQQLGDRDGTEGYWESTANGPAGAFYEMWRSAHLPDSDTLPVFYPWFHDPEYVTEPPMHFALDPDPPNDTVESERDYAERYGLSHPQMYWRRRKALELGSAGLDGWLFFAQEYPACADEAFGGTSLDSFISPQHVEAARRRNSILDPLQAQHPLILGVDPAPSHGNSATAVVWRKGSVCYRIERWRGLSPESLKMRLYEEAVQGGAARICIDESEGVGHSLVTSLQSFGGTAGKVVGVTFGAHAFDRSRYFNQRAELWAKMAAWLSHQATIPDEPAAPGTPTLATELVSVQRKPGNEHVVQLERKSEVIKRLGRSPDGADALAVTFYYPDPEADVGATVVAPHDWRDGMAPQDVYHPPAGDSFVAPMEM